MSRMRCDPADKIIRKFGGLSVVARITSVTVHSVMRWRKPREQGGTGGLIPSRHNQTLLEHAVANDLPITASDFMSVPVASEPERAA